MEPTPPLRRPASYASSRASFSDDSSDSRQAGRSPSSLLAERAAAGLRRSEAGKLKTPSCPDLLRANTSNESQSLGSGPTFTPGLSPPALRRARSSHAPPVPSLLSSSPASIPYGVPTENNGGQRRHSDGSTTSPERSGSSSGKSPLERRRPPPPRPPFHRPMFGSPPGTAHGSPYLSTSTLTMRDLGADYTRYFNPFPDSARSSYSEIPSTPLPRRNGNISQATTPPLTTQPSNPFLTPNASTTKVDIETDSEKGAFLINDRLNAPYEEKGALAWPLLTDDPEDDDDMHMPYPDDDIRFKPKWRDHFSRPNIASTIGLFMMIFGLLFVFVALPVLSSVGIIDYNSMYDTPLDQMDYSPKPEPWATVNNETYPLLQKLRSSLIDPDTPASARTKKGEYGDEFELVFSDEFNDNNRTFYEGDDPYWYAPDLWYGATQDLEWYDPDAVTTWDGTLELRLDKFINHGVNFRSGMLNSWNHLCFKGGIFEVSMSLPGPAAVMGLWPGAWTMGNLGRPGYLSTTEGLWPYTYQACDAGITPNQSSYDGLSRLPGQRLPSCTCPGEDHPTPGTGRGAPEIDIVEAGASYGGLPIATQSYQVAPFDVWWYPDYNFTAFPDYSVSYTNGYTGGPFQQAISATTNLNKKWYDGKEYQKYSFEYVPGEGEDAYIVWKVGGQTTFMMDGRAIGPNGNIQSRQISQEPMSMILNLGLSNSWTWIDWPNLKFPTVMRVDYVRWYQRKGNTSVTCDPPGFETTRYIKDHMAAYTNPNWTKWDQTGYGWPKHKLNTDC